MKIVVWSFLGLAVYSLVRSACASAELETTKVSYTLECKNRQGDERVPSRNWLDGHPSCRDWSDESVPWIAEQLIANKLIRQPDCCCDPSPDMGIDNIDDFARDIHVEYFHRDRCVKLDADFRLQQWGLGCTVAKKDVVRVYCTDPLSMETCQRHLNLVKSLLRLFSYLGYKCGNRIPTKSFCRFPC